MSAVRIDHIGIVVADVEQAAERLRPLFGAPERFVDLPGVGLRVAVIRAANVAIELLEYTGKDDAFARSVMGDRIGINHISAQVPDLNRSIADLESAGMAPMDGFPRRGLHGEVAFFEPDSITGLLFEICQRDAPGEARSDGG